MNGMTVKGFFLQYEGCNKCLVILLTYCIIKACYNFLLATSYVIEVYFCVLSVTKRENARNAIHSLFTTRSVKIWLYTAGGDT